MPTGSRGNSSPTKSGSQRAHKKYKGDTSSQSETDRKTRSSSVEGTLTKAMAEMEKMNEIPDTEKDDIVDLSSDSAECGSGGSNEEDSDQDDIAPETKRRRTNKTKENPEEEERRRKKRGSIYEEN